MKKTQRNLSHQPSNLTYLTFHAQDTLLESQGEVKNSDEPLPKSKLDGHYNNMLQAILNVDKDMALNKEMIKSNLRSKRQNSHL